MSMVYLRNVTTLTYEQNRCNGCGRCVQVCPHRIFHLEQKRAALTNPDLCMECGACSRNCESGAIQVRSGVGCAYAVLVGWWRGTEPDCGCSDDTCC
jgi:NAD-dependent dihydropyrimidine dehydrogenase PreA subunit